MGKVNLLSKGKLWENTEISNVRECPNSHKMEIFCGKPYHSQAVDF